MFNHQKKIAALILAAGESKRLGKPKQNLRYQNKTLLTYIKEQLKTDFVDKTFIVLGAYAQNIMEESELKSSEIIVFNDWQEGMGSSLSYACSKIFKETEYDGILITLSDLPLVTEADYRKMITMFNSHTDIVATRCNNSLGVPAIYGRNYFGELLTIKGEKAAKPIIYNNRERVKVYQNKRACADIDTLGDYKKLG